MSELNFNAPATFNALANILPLHNEPRSHLPWLAVCRNEPTIHHLTISDSQVLDHDVAKLREGMAQLGMAFPCIMKPRVACGTPESHTMALLLKPEGLLESKVPLPASLQVGRTALVSALGCQRKIYAGLLWRTIRFM